MSTLDSMIRGQKICFVFALPFELDSSTFQHVAPVMDIIEEIEDNEVLANDADA